MKIEMIPFINYFVYNMNNIIYKLHIIFFHVFFLVFSRKEKPESNQKFILNQNGTFRI